MRMRGVRNVDSAGSVQIDWLVIPARFCPDKDAESRVVAVHFRVPHEPWVPNRAFVLPVTVRRSRRRVLFIQRSGQA